MNLRDVKPSTLKRIAAECDDEYDTQARRNGFLTFGTQVPLSTKDIWRIAFSAGARAILRRVDALKEEP